MTNWPEYDRGLVERGSLTLWITPEALEAWTPARSGKRGGQRRYSDIAILTAHILRLRFHLTLRATEGFARSLFDLPGLELQVPDHTTLSRRLRELEILAPYVAAETATRWAATIPYPSTRSRRSDLREGERQEARQTVPVSSRRGSVDWSRAR